MLEALSRYGAFRQWENPSTCGEHEEIHEFGGGKYCCKETRFSVLTKEKQMRQVRRITKCQLLLTDVSEREEECGRPSELKKPIAGFVIMEENHMPGKKNGSR